MRNSDVLIILFENPSTNTHILRQHKQAHVGRCLAAFLILSFRGRQGKKANEEHEWSQIEERDEVKFQFQSAMFKIHEETHR